MFFGFRASFESNARRQLWLRKDGEELWLDIETGEVRPRHHEKWHAQRSADGRFEVFYENQPVQQGLAPWLSQLFQPKNNQDDEEQVLLVRNLETGAIKALRRGSFDVEFLPKNEGLLVLTDDTIEVWDFAPRRPIVLILTLAALPSLLFSVLLWWRWGR